MSEQLSFDDSEPRADRHEELRRWAEARILDDSRRAEAQRRLGRAVDAERERIEASRKRFDASVKKLRAAAGGLGDTGQGSPRRLIDLEVVGMRFSQRWYWTHKPLDEVCDDVAAACLHQPVAGRHRADRFTDPKIPTPWPSRGGAPRHAAKSRLGDVVVRSVLIRDYVPYAPPAPPMVRPLRCDSVCERRYDGGPMCDQCGAYPGDLPLPEGATS